MVDSEQLREELTFLAGRKERQDLMLVKQDEMKMKVTEEEMQKKVAMREEEQEWLTSSSFQV